MKRRLALLCVVLTAWPSAGWAVEVSRVITVPFSGGVSLSAAPALPVLPAFIPAVSAAPAISLAQTMQPAAFGRPQIIPGDNLWATPQASASPTLMQRLGEPMGAWAAPQAAGGKLEAGADFERRAFGAPGEGSGEPVRPPSDGAGNGSLPPSSAGAPREPQAPPPQAAQRAPDPAAETALEYARALDGYKAAEKRRGHSVYGAAAAMVLAPLSLAGAMELVGLKVIGMTTLRGITTALIMACVALMVKGAVELVRVGKARARLAAASTAVVHASGARTKDTARQALQEAESLGRAILAVEALAPKLAALAAPLRRDAAALDDSERRALEALEALLSGAAAPRGDRGLAAMLGSSGLRAIAARRRLLSADAALTPGQAVEEDQALDLLSRRFAQDAGVAEDAEAELAFVLDRLDRLYEAAGPLDARHLELARSAVHALRWSEMARGRVDAGKRVMVLEALLKRQAQSPEAEPKLRREQARGVLQSVLDARQAPPPPF
jgi:hypothetical protein